MVTSSTTRSLWASSSWPWHFPPGTSNLSTNTLATRRPVPSVFLWIRILPIHAKSIPRQWTKCRFLLYCWLANYTTQFHEFFQIWKISRHFFKSLMAEFFWQFSDNRSWSWIRTLIFIIHNLCFCIEIGMCWDRFCSAWLSTTSRWSCTTLCLSFSICLESPCRGPHFLAR